MSVNQINQLVSIKAYDNRSISMGVGIFNIYLLLIDIALKNTVKYK